MSTVVVDEKTPVTSSGVHGRNQDDTNVDSALDFGRVTKVSYFEVE